MLPDPEICRVERIAADDRIAEEVAVYNSLLPGPGELVATMFIEIAEAAQVQRDFESSEVTLVIDHPNERARTVLSPETKCRLAAGLA